MLVTYIKNKKNLNKSGGYFTGTMFAPPCPLPAPSLTQTPHPPTPPHTHTHTHTHTHYYSLSGCLLAFSTQEKYTK